jgi:hypothetical protein
LRRRAAAALFLSLALTGAAVADDRGGWNGTSWGMSTVEVDAALGDAVRIIDPPLVYGGAQALRTVPDIEVGGYTYRALLQFADSDGGLQQVLLQRSRLPEAPKAYAAALDALTAEHGEPALVCDSPHSGAATSPISRERVWRAGATTIHLVFIDFSGGSMQYDSLQDIDPLVPDRERRLHSTRSYPQRLLIRYHPSERTDLMSKGCGG